jgi:biotin operon repressor
MSNTRKTRPGIAVPGRAVENGRVCKTVQSPTSEHTTSPAERQSFRIADLLHSGAENAISRRDLIALTGLSDRELRLMIENERRQGIPILSDNIHGYFLPGDSAERDRCVRSLRRRAGEIMETAAAIERGGDEV